MPAGVGIVDESGLGRFLNLIHCLTTLTLQPYVCLRLLSNDAIAPDGSLDGLDHRHAAYVAVDLGGIRRRLRLLASHSTSYRPFKDHVFRLARFSVSKMRLSM